MTFCKYGELCQRNFYDNIFILDVYKKEITGIGLANYASSIIKC